MAPLYEVHGLAVLVDSLWPELTAWTRIGGERNPDLRINTRPESPRPKILSQLSWKHCIDFIAPGALDIPVECGQPIVEIESALSSHDMFVRVSFSYVRSRAVFVIGPGGRDVWASWDGGGEEESLVRRGVATLLQGCVWGMLLHIRGVVWLHGNVIAFDGKSIILLGHSGAGKSTLSAALATEGAVILADDKAVIKSYEGTFLMEHGGRFLRLKSDSLAAIRWPFETLICNAARANKHPVSFSRPVSEHQRATPLAAIYVLAPRAAARRRIDIQPLSPAAGLCELLRYRYGLFACPPQQIATEYQQLSDLARTIPIRRLHCPDDLRVLPQTTAALLRDMEVAAR
jgi:hypothetical protein